MSFVFRAMGGAKSLSISVVISQQRPLLLATVDETGRSDCRARR